MRIQAKTVLGLAMLVVAAASVPASAQSCLQRCDNLWPAATHPVCNEICKDECALGNELISCVEFGSEIGNLRYTIGSAPCSMNSCGAVTGIRSCGNACCGRMGNRTICTVACDTIWPASTHPTCNARCKERCPFPLLWCMEPPGPQVGSCCPQPCRKRCFRFRRRCR